MSTIAPWDDDRGRDAERESIGRLLYAGLERWEERLQEGLAGSGYGDVRPSHYAVFRHLKPEGSRVMELARQARMTKQSMGEVVSYLERCGYVERRPDPRDRRARVVIATAKGRKGYGAAVRRVAEIEAALAERLGEEGLEESAVLLEKIAAYLAEPLPVRKR